MFNSVVIKVFICFSAKENRPYKASYTGIFLDHLIRTCSATLLSVKFAYCSIPCFPWSHAYCSIPCFPWSHARRFKTAQNIRLPLSGLISLGFLLSIHVNSVLVCIFLKLNCMLAVFFTIYFVYLFRFQPLPLCSQIPIYFWPDCLFQLLLGPHKITSYVHSLVMVG